jgi:hypothetical protein
MRTKLERAHDISSIGTFALTIIVVALMVIPMLWPSGSSPQHDAALSGGQRMIGWILPSILALSLILAGILHLLAARSTAGSSMRRDDRIVGAAIIPGAPSLPVVPSVEGRIFVGQDITARFLTGLLEGHTSIQASKVIEPYIDKWMQLSGEVANVGEFRHGSSTVTFINEPLDPNVFMRFNETWIPRLSILRRTNYINVIGKINSIDKFSVILDECELI